MNLGEHIIENLTFEFKALKRMADRSLEQLQDELFFHSLGIESNSPAIIVQHISGNLRSRFTDFLTTDGEKPDRNRDAEFEESNLSREEIMKNWELSWQILFDALSSLSSEKLVHEVTIRGEKCTTLQALMRQITHYGGHCGQIVYIVKLMLGQHWETLTIPRGKSKTWQPMHNAEQKYFKK